MSFIAGQYLPTYKAPGGSALSTGQVKDGIRIDHTVFKRKIRGDNFADTDQDAVYRGINVFLQLTLLEYNAAACPGIFWPYAATFLTLGTGIGNSNTTPVGRLDSALSGEMVLTALANTPAGVAAAPATITASHTILAEGYPVSLLLAPDLREVPLRLQAYPYTAASNTVFAVLT